MTTPAVRLLTISVTPCSLLHNDAPIVGGVDLLGLNPDRDRFDVARSSDFDSSLSFTIAPQRINLLIHESTGLKWESRPELETWLPPVRIQTRQGTTIKTELELGSSTPLEAPISVVRSGSDTDLMIWIRFVAGSTLPKPPADGDYCRLSWYVDGLPRSLRFAAVGQASGVPLILRPKRED